jgi:hypothetical protein
VASPNTFKWRKNAGSWTTGVAITGAAQTLADGVTVTFSALTGHTLTDTWNIACANKPWLYTPNDHWIYQDPTETVLEASDYMEIEYYVLGADVISVSDTTAIDARHAIEGGTGVYTRLYDDPNQNSQETGAVVAAQLVDTYKSMPTEIKYTTLTPGLAPGQLQTVTIARHAVSGEYLINEVRAYDDGGQMKYDIVGLSGVRLGQYLDMFKRMVASGGYSGSAASAPSGGGGGGGGGTAATANSLSAITLTAADEIAVGDGIPAIPAPVEPAILIVVLTQDATGGRQITWSTDFKLATVEIDTTPDTVSIFSFVARADGKWWMVGTPITGQTP